MAHYAKVLDGLVVKVIVAEADFFDTFVDTSPGEWIQTSYNTSSGVHKLGGTPLRGNFAGYGFSYNRELDAFIPPKPYASWILNEETFSWNAPTAYPQDDKRYKWNEDILNWEELPE